MGYCDIIGQVINFNGEQVDSILFTDLLSHFNNDRTKTKEVYKYIYSQSFRKQFGDFISEKELGKKLADTDINGEPIIGIALDYFNNKKEILEPKSNLDSLKEVVVDAVNKLTIDIGKYSKIGTIRAEETAEELVDIKKELQNKETLLGIVNYIQFAYKNLNRYKTYLNDNFETIDDAYLTKIRNFSQSFTGLEQLQTELNKLKKEERDQLIEELDEDIQVAIKPYIADKLNIELGEAIATKNEIFNLYLNKSKLSISNLLSAFNTNVNLTTEGIRKLLTKSKDISFFNRWFMSIKNAPDQILQLIAKVTFEQSRQARQESNKVSKELAKAEEVLIEYQKTKGVNTNNSEELYDFLLEDTKGQKSGKFVGEYDTAAFWEDFNNNISSSEKLGRKITKEEFLNNQKWFSENTVTVSNWLEQYESKKALYSEGKLSKRDYDKWISKNIRFDYQMGANELLPTPKLGGDLTKPSNKWLSTKYKTIQSTPELKEFYDLAMRIMSEAQSKINPSYVRGSQIPSVRKDFYERFIEGGMNWENIKEEFNTNTKVKDRVEEYEYGQQDADGRLVNYIPIHFSSKIINPALYSKEALEAYDGKFLDVNQVSFDITKSISMYYSMANEYEKLEFVTTQLEMTEDLLKERQIVKTDSWGKQIFNSLLGKENKIPQTTKGSDSNSLARFKTWVEMYVYGQDKRYEEILGVSSKSIDTIMNYNSLTSLALNPFSGFSNITMGAVVRSIEAKGSKYYTSKNLRKAYQTYFRQGTVDMMADHNNRISKNKINLLRQIFDIDESVVKDRVFIKRSLKDKAYILQDLGEHMLSSLSMLAILDNTQIDGQSLLSQITIVEGEVEFPDGFGVNELRNLSFKIAEEIKSKDGAYTKEERSASQQFMLGRLAFQFRKWIIPTVRDRFLFERDEEGNITTHYNQFNGMDEKGYYVSTYEFTKNIFLDIKKQQININSRWNEMSDLDKENIKKFGMEMTFLILSGLIASALKAANGDDEDKNRQLAFLEYQAKRLSTELGFYLPIIGIQDQLKILKEPLAATNTFGTIGALFNQIIGVEIDEEEGINFTVNDIYKQGKNKGTYKVIKYSKSLVPIIPQIERYIKQ